MFSIQNDQPVTSRGDPAFVFFSLKRQLEHAIKSILYTANVPKQTCQKITWTDRHDQIPTASGTNALPASIARTSIVNPSEGNRQTRAKGVDRFRHSVPTPGTRGSQAAMQKCGQERGRAIFTYTTVIATTGPRRRQHGAFALSRMRGRLST
ncbi:hypothetical protein BaRGS_00016786 [Batillaria attramentaria]|uniref:Uncharacterized protein n=1 Tax=Batillaria attramentaria TaxID=370345 RepID=A0ABD0KXY2_9CAEN